MNFKAKFTLAFRDFIKNYGKPTLIILAVWIVIFTLNQYLISKPKEIKLIKHDLNTPVMDDTKRVSSGNQRKIQATVKEYFDYCNSKQYEKAFNMITDDCKYYVYKNDIENFKRYIDSIYDTHKVYYLQNYSNVDDTYVYILGIMDNIEATGTTGGYKLHEERIALIKYDDTFKIACDNYIKNEKIGIEKSDAFLKVNVASKELSYTREEYNLTVTNLTDNDIIIANFDTNKEVELNLGNQLRSAMNIANSTFRVKAHETETMSFIFRKYFDDDNTPTQLRLNAVRIISNYDNSIMRNYSFNIDL